MLPSLHILAHGLIPVNHGHLLRPPAELGQWERVFSILQCIVGRMTSQFAILVFWLREESKHSESPRREGVWRLNLGFYLYFCTIWCFVTRKQVHCDACKSSNGHELPYQQFGEPKSPSTNSPGIVKSRAVIWRSWIQQQFHIKFWAIWQWSAQEKC